MQDLELWAAAGRRQKAIDHLAFLHAACAAVALLGKEKSASKLEEQLVKEINGERS